SSANSKKMILLIFILHFQKITYDMLVKLRRKIRDIALVIKRLDIGFKLTSERELQFTITKHLLLRDT
ncbi:hypothetical protein, partial [uncultured Muribaculum sp.]|uniref:hypothetical protein n=1 Tax=uncultured Muribaculum sp. TaxID=1918613 RepID=UPI00272D3159